MNAQAAVAAVCVRPASALLALAVLLAPWAGASAQQETMSLEEASYRAGKARIMARYHDDLATCKGLGNPHARSACAAAAGVNRDTARRALRNDTGPTRLSRFLAQVASEQAEAGHAAAHGHTHAPAKAASPLQLATATLPRGVKQGSVDAQARAEPETSRMDGFAMALKTHYGGN